MYMKKLAILGCGGFIGSHLLDELLSRHPFAIEGWDPDDRKIAGHLTHPGFRLHRKTLQDPTTLGDLERTIREADAVINLAAICNPSDYNTRPLDVIRANFFDLWKIVEICAEHGKWILHFSTSEVYGRTIASYLPDNAYEDGSLYELEEDTTPLIMGPIVNQRWSYACAKQLMERFIYAHHKEHGLPFTIVRPLNFFGPRMDFIPGRDGDGLPRVLACFMTALLDGKPMQLVDGGHARRTILSIREAVGAIVAMLYAPEQAQNQIFNLGNRDNEVTMARLADLMRRTYAKITQNPAYEQHPIVEVSSRDFYGEGYEDCDRRMPSVEKARTRLGWIPKIPLETVLFETMSDYHERYGARPADLRAPRIGPRPRPRPRDVVAG